jgi:hypothetical protein
MQCFENTQKGHLVGQWQKLDVENVPLVVVVDNGRGQL